jgi:hypothetical protein
MLLEYGQRLHPPAQRAGQQRARPGGHGHDAAGRAGRRAGCGRHWRVGRGPASRYAGAGRTARGAGGLDADRSMLGPCVCQPPHQPLTACGWAGVPRVVATAAMPCTIRPPTPLCARRAIAHRTWSRCHEIDHRDMTARVPFALRVPPGHCAPAGFHAARRHLPAAFAGRACTPWRARCPTPTGTWSACTLCQRHGRVHPGGHAFALRGRPEPPARWRQPVPRPERHRPVPGRYV